MEMQPPKSAALFNLELHRVQNYNMGDFLSNILKLTLEKKHLWSNNAYCQKSGKSLS